jgi:hypothetical protein
VPWDFSWIRTPSVSASAACFDAIGGVEREDEPAHDQEHVRDSAAAIPSEYGREGANHAQHSEYVHFHLGPERGLGAQPPRIGM